MSVAIKLAEEAPSKRKAQTKLTKIELEDALFETREELSEAQLQLEELAILKTELASVLPDAEAYREMNRELGPIEQIRVAFSGANRLALFFGSIFGGFIPYASYGVFHNEIAWDAHGVAMLVFALGALAFSAKTVYQWGFDFFKQDRLKAGAFVLLCEGLMTLTYQKYLGIAALVILIFVNAVATGVTAAKR